MMLLRIVLYYSLSVSQYERCAARLAALYVGVSQLRPAALCTTVACCTPCDMGSWSTAASRTVLHCGQPHSTPLQSGQVSYTAACRTVRHTGHAHLISSHVPCCSQRSSQTTAADRTHIPCHLSYYTTASHVLIRLQTSALTTMCAAALSAQVRPLRPTALASLRPTALTSLRPVLPPLLLDHCSAQY